jgi:hypothetical protein
LRITRRRRAWRTLIIISFWKKITELLDNMKLHKIWALVIAAPLSSTTNAEALSTTLSAEIAVLVDGIVLGRRCSNAPVFNGTRLQWWGR